MYTESPDTFDRSSPLPIYLQLANWAEAKIVEGQFAVGAKLPSESQMARQFRLNRNTVRQAIALLVQSGLVEKRKGIGNFVVRGTALLPTHQLGRMTSFVDDFQRHAVEIEDVILSKEKVKAPAEVAARMTLGPGDWVVRIERLRIAEKVPLVLERSHYSFRDFGRLLEMDLRGSLYQLLVSEFGADLHHSTQTLRAVRPAKQVALKLGISQEVPCMFLESLAYTSQNQCLEVLQSYYRGDRYVFKVEAGQYRRELLASAARA